MRNSVILYTDFTDRCLLGSEAEETVECYKNGCVPCPDWRRCEQAGAHPEVIAVEAERA
jgi:hypothetical protein